MEKHIWESVSLKFFGELEIPPLGFEWRIHICMDGSIGSKIWTSYTL